MKGEFKKEGPVLHKQGWGKICQLVEILCGQREQFSQHAITIGFKINTKVCKLYKVLRETGEINARTRDKDGKSLTKQNQTVRFFMYKWKIK